MLVASSDLAVALDGELASLGTGLDTLGRRTAFYVQRILGDAKPADRVVARPYKYTLSANLKTAAAIGVTIPQSLLLRADEVIR